MDESVKKNLSSGRSWFRLLFMIFFYVINYFVQIFIGILALFQFIATLIRGKPNERLQSFSVGLSRFVYQMISYLTYGTEEKPFPFSEWPEEGMKKPEVPLKEAKAESKVEPKTESKAKTSTATAKPKAKAAPKAAAQKAPAKKPAAKKTTEK